MHNYLIENIDQTITNDTIKELLKKEKIENNTISTYDLEETSLSNALEDLDTYSLFSSKKVIIIKNIDSLKIDDSKEEINHLIKYLKDPNPDNYLIITSKKLNNTTKLTKELKDKCNIINTDIDINKYIKDNLKDYKIDLKATNLLKEYCLDDITKLKQELNKLKDYKVEEKIITTEDIKKLVIKKLPDSKDLVFSFTRSIGERNKKEALEKFQELLNYNIEPISIIGLLGSQIRIIYQVKLLENRNLSNKEIAELLGEKSDYRIKKTKELTRYYKEKDLLNLMKELSDIDLKLKTTDVNPILQIQTFIINI